MRRPRSKRMGVERGQGQYKRPEPVRTPPLLAITGGVIEEGMYNSQTAVVLTLLHVPGVPPFVHTNSLAAESM
jgi:hypothetical protein